MPYGVYDLAANSGWVSVGVDHDTAAFAVNSIRQWCQAVGRARYPDATRLLITADGGGSNGSRVRLWKRELQKLANELGLDIVVSHLPPGTSKWNKIEHRLFSFISQNWRAKPLVSYRVIVDLISATTTKTGLTVRCELDTGQYPSGIVVSDAEMAAINIQRAEFRGEWNSGTTLSRRITVDCKHPLVLRASADPRSRKRLEGSDRRRRERMREDVSRVRNDAVDGLGWRTGWGHGREIVGCASRGVP